MKRIDIFSELENIQDIESDLPKVLSNLHYTHFFLMGAYRKILEHYDLSPIQSNVLGIIGHFQPAALSLEEIKGLILEQNSDVSRVVSRLVEKKYVQKIPNPSNRRKVAIVLTTEGERVFKRLEADKKFRKFTASLSLAEARSFTKILSKLRNS